MNIENAIDVLLGKYGQADEKAEDAIAKAVKALEKQIPKKPIFKYCPRCSGRVMDYAEYCYKCGQKIDWEGLG